MKNTNIPESKSLRKIRGTVSGKLLRFILPMIIISIVLLIVILTSRASSVITMQASNGLKQESRANAAALGNTMIEFETYLNTIGEAVATVEFPDDEALVKYLEPSLTAYDFAPNGVYIGLENGTWLDPSGWQPDPDYIITDRDWYILGKNVNTFIAGIPYVDSSTNSMVVTLSCGVTLPDGRFGVIAADMNLDGIVAEVTKFTPLGSGHTMLMDGDMILSYSDPSYNGSSASEHSDDAFLTRSASYVKSGNDEIARFKDNSGRDTFVSFDSVPGTEWTLISSVSASAVLSEMNSFLILAAILMLVIIAVIAAVILNMIRHIVSRPVKSLTDNISMITTGDFTVDIPKGGNDEIGTMNNSMHDYVSHMRGTLGEMKEISNNLIDEAVNSQEASGKLNTQAEEQSESMHQIREAINGMNLAVSELASNATDLASEVSELADKGTVCNDTVISLVSKAKEGQHEMSIIQSGMADVSESMADMAAVVEHVDSSAQTINSIISMISSIAAQTNLLSLNASIEAARAGEAGRGFAVVASEIGQLANESAGSANQIGQIVKDITAQISELLEKSNKNMSSIEQNATAVKNAGSTFEEIFKDLDLTNDTVTDMIEKVRKVDDIATSLAAISQEQSASTQEITATVDNVAESALRVADSSKGVDESATTVFNSAKKIEDFVNTFTI
ncbi:methyl-accepting chemotaxis protein [Butyrivibrio sp. MC2013]|uniref:methyl-accepting chemotaxis protein n=1 Tax=Butyrivibrio sp. MC2013 TaxID=1280686 RepID=UPI00040E3997|nr:methyl-accepting chemotaxis protein [Butyrivibrio sp. MC2013]